MIPNIAGKRLFASLNRITSKHQGDFYCLNCLHSFREEHRLKSHEKACKNKGFLSNCNAIPKG